MGNRENESVKIFVDLHFTLLSCEIETRLKGRNISFAEFLRFKDLKVAG